MSKKGLYALALLIIFAVYNVLVFTVGGFIHGAGFWISYAFFAVALVMVGYAGLVLGKKEINAGNWFFNYPIIKHIFTYAAIELVASIIFMLLDPVDIPLVAFVVQFVLLCVYAVIIIICFMAKSAVDESYNEVKQKTAEFGTIKIAANRVYNMCDDQDAKARLLKFAENVKYSDPMGNPAVASIEGEIKNLISKMEEQIQNKDFEGVKLTCARADALLLERNEKVKLLK